MSPPVPGRAVRVVVPASSANLGPGFDSLGLALGVFDTYHAAVTAEPGLRIEVAGDSQGVPLDERHLVYATMRRAWSELGVPAPEGVRLHCASTVRQGRGMGSSAAAIVAGVAAAHGLCFGAESGPSRPEAQQRPVEPGAVPIHLDLVNDLASRLEGHPDNASASVYGGATISWIGDEPAPPATSVTSVTSATPGDASPAESAGAPAVSVHSVRIPLHPDVTPLVIVPQVQLPTATARAVLPAQVPHGEAALNSARAGLLVLALSSRPDLLLPATREWLHQEQRRSSFGGAMELVDELRAAGHAAVISGAGPSVLVLSADDSALASVANLVPHDWQLLTPGIPEMGVCVERVTLGELPGEGALPA
nr:homoserine kinase [Kineosphaera limosa]